MKSSGKSASIGSSVDPGLPKIVVIPLARKRSKEASRTLAMGEARNPKRQRPRAGNGSRLPSWPASR